MKHVKQGSEVCPFTLKDHYTRVTVSTQPANIDVKAFIHELVQGRPFKRWFKKHRKMLLQVGIMTPLMSFGLTGMIDACLPYILPAPGYEPAIKGMLPVNAYGESFANTHGMILIHMLVIGFLTLVVTTFLRFTGRGDIIPLIAFVGGGAILYEVLGMFKDIYGAIRDFIMI